MKKVTTEFECDKCGVKDNVGHNWEEVGLVIRQLHTLIYNVCDACMRERDSQGFVKTDKSKSVFAWLWGKR